MDTVTLSDKHCSYCKHYYSKVVEDKAYMYCKLHKRRITARKRYCKQYERESNSYRG